MTNLQKCGKVNLSLESPVNISTTGGLKMRKVKFVSVFVLLALLLSVGPGAVMSQEPPPIRGAVRLSPEVEIFIAKTYLAHASEFPDPNESVEILEQYLEGQKLLRGGDVETAIQLFEKAVEHYPDSRHTHAGLALAFSHRSRASGDIKDIRSAAAEFIQAAEIGMEFGKVHYTPEIAKNLALSKDVETLDAFFERVVALEPDNYRIALDYARGLHLLDDPRAPQWYKKAISLQPPSDANSDANFDARAYYAEWLLEHGSDSDVLQLLRSDEDAQYLHFLRGVALERLGELNEAQAEYRQYEAFSERFPAPARFRIIGSQAQSAVVFEGATRSQTDGMLTDFSQLISCEAHNETQGGMRAVGWTVRTRVMRGSMGSDGTGGPCLDVDNSGMTLAHQYLSVMYQPNQFTTDCGKPRTPTTDHVADDVYSGWAPDPVGRYCPRQTCPTFPCSAYQHCSLGGVYGASQYGPAVFYSNMCPDWGVYGCAQDPDFTCENGGDDNCFFRIPGDYP